MALSTRDSLIAAQSNTAQIVNVNKMLLQSRVANVIYTQSYWLAPGYLPQPGAVQPTTAATLDATSIGGLPVAAAGGTNTLYLSGVNLWMSGPGALTIADRMAHNGNLSGTVSTAQSVNISVPARATSSAGVHAYLECYIQIGTNVTTGFSISYTNSAGVAGRTATVLGGNNINAGQAGGTGMYTNTLLPFQLATGDLGVSSVQSLTLSASSGAVGNLGITLARPVLTGSVAASAGGPVRRTFAATMIDLTASPCLSLFGWTGGDNIRGTLSVVEG